MVHCFVGATGNWSGQCRAPATESVATRARQRISISCRDPQALQTRTSPRPLIYRAVWIALSFQACSWSTPQATSRLSSLTKNENQTTRITQSVVKGTTSGPAAESLGRGMIGYYFRGIPCARASSLLTQDRRNRQIGPASRTITSAPKRSCFAPCLRT